MPAAKNICLRGHIKEMGKDCISCRPIFKEKYRKNLSDEKTSWRVLRDTVKQGGFIINITYEEYLSLREKPCFYCGDEFQRGRHSYSLDRVDNAKGYLRDNIVPCCYRCNHAKAKLTQDEFIKLCHLVSERFPRTF